VINDDAGKFIRQSSHAYDVVIADLVDPSSDRIARLYSTDFYKDVHKKITKNGIFITQATSSYFTPHAFDIIANNVEQVFGRSNKVSENIPSFGEWGFVSNTPKEATAHRALPQTNFVTKESLARAQYVPSSRQREASQQISSMLTPTLHFAYNKDMARWSY
jgi:spermidine synthase